MKGKILSDLIDKGKSARFLSDPPFSADPTTHQLSYFGSAATVSRLESLTAKHDVQTSLHLIPSSGCTNRCCFASRSRSNAYLSNLQYFELVANAGAGRRRRPLGTSSPPRYLLKTSIFPFFSLLSLPLRVFSHACHLTKRVQLHRLD